jgi:PAS domain S-box-containing protein
MHLLYETSTQKYADKRENHVNKLSIMRGLIFLTSFMVIIGLLWFIESAIKQYNQVNKSWTSYSDTEAVIVETVLELNAHLGYGGLIDHFKNFVIRDEPKYEVLLIDIAAINAKLETLENYFENEKELQALEVIDNVVNEYANKIATISRMHQLGEKVEAIDYAVKISDKAALEALKIIHDETVKRSVEVQSETDLLMDKADNFLKEGRLLSVPVILFSFLLFYYIRQIKKTSDEVLKSQKWADTLLDTSPEATIITNPFGEIIRVNKMAIELFGYTNDEFIALTIKQLIPEQSVQFHNKVRDAFFKNSSVQLKEADKRLHAILKNGSKVKVEISMSMTKHVLDKSMVAIASFRDITEREENKRLTEEAKNLAESALNKLEKAQDSLVESKKMAALGELVAGIAHEINTPIGNALSSSTFINDETLKVANLYNDEDLSGEELEEYLSYASNATKLIENNLARAADLINSFKSMAVDQAGGEKRRFELDGYIHEVLLNIHPVIKKSNISVTHNCDKDIIMNTYPGALSQCLSNLVINGIIHGFSPEEKGNVLVSAKYIDTKNVLISVSDNGKGIPESLHKKVYDPFYTTKRSAGGSGLGLQIVHNLVCHNLGGSIKIRSTEGKGTIFILELPSEFTYSPTIEEHK